MTAFRVILVLCILLVLLGGEILLARLHVGILVAPLLGVGMAVLVATTFMRLAASTGLPRVFALAAAFWLVVLLGMGSLDALTRHDALIKSWVGRAVPPRPPVDY